MSTEQEMAAAIAAAEHDDELEDDRPIYTPSPARDPGQVYSIRIPMSRLEELRRVAADQGVPPSTLIRSWVIERLDDRVNPRPTMNITVLAHSSAKVVHDVVATANHLDAMIADVLAENAESRIGRVR